MLGSKKNVLPDYQHQADCARRLILQSSLEILRHILRPEIGEFSIHLLYNTRCGR